MFEEKLERPHLLVLCNIRLVSLEQSVRMTRLDSIAVSAICDAVEAGFDFLVLCEGACMIWILVCEVMTSTMGIALLADLYPLQIGVSTDCYIVYTAFGRWRDVGTNSICFVFVRRPQFPAWFGRWKLQTTYEVTLCWCCYCVQLLPIVWRLISSKAETARRTTMPKEFEQQIEALDMCLVRNALWHRHPRKPWRGNGWIALHPWLW